ncbi:hypothetical protein CDD83_4603 [Cordyceps sp. RAO-2017]|nr:hypothetical protein CDD83_4603 [Cordyceps sp. RAO-2017]
MKRLFVFTVTAAAVVADLPHRYWAPSRPDGSLKRLCEADAGSITLVLNGGAHPGCSSPAGRASIESMDTAFCRAWDSQEVGWGHLATCHGPDCHHHPGQWDFARDSARAMQQAMAATSFYRHRQQIHDLDRAMTNFAGLDSQVFRCRHRGHRLFLFVDLRQVSIDDPRQLATALADWMTLFAAEGMHRELDGFEFYLDSSEFRPEDIATRLLDLTGHLRERSYKAIFSMKEHIGGLQIQERAKAANLRLDGVVLPRTASQVTCDNGQGLTWLLRSTDEAGMRSRGGTQAAQLWERWAGEGPGQCNEILR